MIDRRDFIQASLAVLVAAVIPSQFDPTEPALDDDWDDEVSISTCYHGDTKP